MRRSQSVHIIVDIIPQRDVLLEKLTIEQYKEEYSLNIEHKNTYPVINNGENTNEKEISAENRLKYYSLSSNYLGENIGKDMIALIFREPINPEDITAVVIDGTVIELK